MRVRRWMAFGGLLLVAVILTGCAVFDPAPTVNFTWNPSGPLARTEVQFTDLSTDSGGLFGGGGIVSWNWDFGDNDDSQAQNPKHVYQSDGAYDVEFTVTDSSGNSATSKQTVNVSPSLDGRWAGTLWDAVQNAWQLELDLRQTTTGGGITGTAWVNARSCNILSASYIPSSGEVRIMFAYWGTGNIWLLVGIYDGLEYISGYWENITLAPGVRIGDWEVRLQ